ncbi:hypothetical protein FNV43_RR23364 [Rhamnella rubrinervis]|uniref:Uncharacterized protein n=1 Tax=Rhamnella rubrinervis TaxID=2594499 RepID=A0A8K0GP32_9ROSA|nr:hypothetical protein FNV43_RR23364 [Rhamnella rubrinervis]
MRVWSSSGLVRLRPGLVRLQGSPLRFGDLVQNFSGLPAVRPPPCLVRPHLVDFTRLGQLHSGLVRPSERSELRTIRLHCEHHPGLVRLHPGLVRLPPDLVRLHSGLSATVELVTSSQNVRLRRAWSAVTAWWDLIGLGQAIGVGSTLLGLGPAVWRLTRRVVRPSGQSDFIRAVGFVDLVDFGRAEAVWFGPTSSWLGPTSSALGQTSLRGPTSIRLGRASSGVVRLSRLCQISSGRSDFITAWSDFVRAVRLCHGLVRHPGLGRLRSGLVDFVRAWSTSGLVRLRCLVGFVRQCDFPLGPDFVLVWSASWVWSASSGLVRLRQGGGPYHRRWTSSGLVDFLRLGRLISGLVGLRRGLVRTSSSLVRRWAVRLPSGLVRLLRAWSDFVLAWSDFIRAWSDFIRVWSDFVLAWSDFIRAWSDFVLAWSDFIRDWSDFACLGGLIQAWSGFIRRGSTSSRLCQISSGLDQTSSRLHDAGLVRLCPGLVRLYRTWVWSTSSRFGQTSGRWTLSGRDVTAVRPPGLGQTYSGLVRLRGRSTSSGLVGLRSGGRLPTAVRLPGQWTRLGGLHPELGRLHLGLVRLRGSPTSSGLGPTSLAVELHRHWWDLVCLGPTSSARSTLSSLVRLHPGRTSSGLGPFLGRWASSLFGRTSSRQCDFPGLGGLRPCLVRLRPGLVRLRPGLVGFIRTGPYHAGASSGLRLPRAWSDLFLVWSDLSRLGRLRLVWSDVPAVTSRPVDLGRWTPSRLGPTSYGLGPTSFGFGPTSSGHGPTSSRQASTVGLSLAWWLTSGFGGLCLAWSDFVMVWSDFVIVWSDVERVRLVGSGLHQGLVPLHPGLVTSSAIGASSGLGGAVWLGRLYQGLVRLRLVWCRLDRLRSGLGQAVWLGPTSSGLDPTSSGSGLHSGLLGVVGCGLHPGLV